MLSLSKHSPMPFVLSLSKHHPKAHPSPRFVPPV